jgi:hypothetical protein
MSKWKVFLLVSIAAAVSSVAALAVQEQRTRREPQFENDEVKVWKSIIYPNQPLSMHRHEHGRALIALKGGKLNVVDEAGSTVDTYDWETGKAYWLDADPPGKVHGDLYEGQGTIEVIVVEMKD